MNAVIVQESEIQYRSKDMVIQDQAWLPRQNGLAMIFYGPDTFFRQRQIGIISYPQLQFRQVTADTNDYSSLSVSSDGSTIASVMRQSTRDVYVSTGAKPDYSDAKQLSSGEVLWTVSWSSDGKVLAEQDATIKQIGLDGMGASLPGKRTQLRKTRMVVLMVSWSSPAPSPRLVRVISG